MQYNFLLGHNKEAFMAAARARLRATCCNKADDFFIAHSPKRFALRQQPSLAWPVLSNAAS